MPRYSFIFKLYSIFILALALVLSSCEDLGSIFEEQQYSFSGPTSAQYSSSGKVTVSWSPVSVSGEGETNIEYKVFVVEDNETNLIFDNSNFISQPTAKTPSSKELGPPLAQTANTYATFLWEFALSKAYLIYIQAENKVDGTIIGSAGSLSFAVASNAPTFDGLQDTEVSLDALGNIVLEWAPASNTVGSLKYLVFDSTTFVTPIAITKENTYVLKNPIKGRTYNLAVRAQDDRGQDDNNEIVSYLIPDPSDKTPPEFNGLKLAHAVSEKSIYLEWDASPSEDIAVYRIYNSNNLISPVATTSSTSKVVTPLSTNTEYTYVVRAVDASGNIDQNTVIKSATTLSYEVPQFDGISQASPRPGVEGLTKIKLTWTPAVFNPTHPSTIRGYLIYYAEADALFPPVANVVSTDIGQNTALITGLSEATQYKFLVRAYYQDGVGASLDTELNQNIKFVSTLTRKAPTFGGLASVDLNRLESGSAVAELKWNTPSSDGILNGYKVYYEPGTCSQPFTAGATEVDINGTATLSAEISSLTVGTMYRFKVHTFYPEDTFNGYPALIDSNNSCVQFTPVPSAADFDGVAGISQVGGTDDFNQFTATWSAPIGDCDNIEVSVTTNAYSPNFATPYKTTSDCTATSVVVDGLTKGTTYYVQARAVLFSGGDYYYSGMGTELSATTAIDINDSDGVKSVGIITVNNGPDLIDLKWDLPADGHGWSHIYVWRSFHIDESTATSQVRTLADSTMGNVADYQKDSGDYTNTQIQDAVSFEAELGGFNCFLTRAVFWDGTNWAASENDKVQCIKPSFTQPIFTGVASATYDAASYDDSGSGTDAERNFGYVDINFQSKPSGSYDGFHIYYSKFIDPITFDFEHPIHSVEAGSVEDLSQGSSKLKVKMNLSKIKEGYFVVRWYAFGSNQKDTNTVVSSKFNGLGTAVLNSKKVYPDPSGEILNIDFPEGAAFTVSTLPTDARVIWSEKVDATGSLTGTIYEIPLGVNECASAPAGGPCVFDFSIATGFNLGKWIPRFYQVVGMNGPDLFKSPVFGHALVPNNMVYIDKNLWPQDEGRYTKYWERYSFAVDKYNITLSDADYPSFTWGQTNVKFTNDSENNYHAIFDQRGSTACHGRPFSDDAAHFNSFMDSSEHASLSRVYHVQKALDYYISSYGTPNAGHPDYETGSTTLGCGRSATMIYEHWPMAVFDKDEGVTTECVSEFGVRNQTLTYPNESLGNRSNNNRLHRIPVRFPSQTRSTSMDLRPGISILRHKSELIPVNDRHAKMHALTDLTYNDKNYTSRNIDWETGAPIYGKYTPDSTDVWTFDNLAIDYDYPWTYQFGLPLIGDNRPQISSGSRSHGYLGGTWAGRQLRCSINSPFAGKLRTQNDSSGSNANIRWRAWGQSNVKIRIAVAKSQNALDKWDGGEVIGSLADELYTVNSFSECDNTDFNNHYYDLDVDETFPGTLTTGSSVYEFRNYPPKAMFEKPTGSTSIFRLQGRCGIDISSLNPWEKRWIRVSAQYGTETPVKGDTHIVGRVPDNMVMVAKEDWPDKTKHKTAAKLGESYTAPYDFAIDKYLGYYSGTLAHPAKNGTTPSATNYPVEIDMDNYDPGYMRYRNDGKNIYYGMETWYPRQLCDQRTEELKFQDPDTDWQLPDYSLSNYAAGKRIHPLEGIEFVVAGFDTPDAYNPTFCQIMQQDVHNWAQWKENTYPGNYNQMLDPEEIFTETATDPDYSLFDGKRLTDGRGATYSPSLDQTITGLHGSDNCISRYGVRNMRHWGVTYTSEVYDFDNKVIANYISRTGGDPFVFNGSTVGPKSVYDTSVNSSNVTFGAVKSWDFDKAFPIETTQEPAEFDNYVFGPGAYHQFPNHSNVTIGRGGLIRATGLYGMANASENSNRTGKQNLHLYFMNGGKDNSEKGGSRPSRFGLTSPSVRGYNIAVMRCSVRSPVGN